MDSNRNAAQVDVLMDPNDAYHEQLRSGTTESLFVGLMLTGLLLFLWQLLAGGSIWLIGLFLLVFLLFLFYSLNFRTLTIHMTSTNLVLKFGMFTWEIPVDNIEQVYLDQTSMRRIGGAGIHFTPLDGHYRAFFNFLEYSRVVVVLKEKKGPVEEVAFSTRHPEEILARCSHPAGDTLPV
jgi:hypothetical protein